MPNFGVYTTNPKTDGWFSVPEEKPHDFIVRVKVEFNKHYSIPSQHYFLKGKCCCGRYQTLPSGAARHNNPAGYNSECLKAMRKQVVEKAMELRAKGEAGDIEGAEAENVIDYKAAREKDHPESAKASHP